MPFESATPEAKHNTSSHILLIDDEVHIQKLLAIKLRQFGYELTFASDGAQALQSIAIVHPDLIICDVMMPNMDGLTFLKQLRSNAETKSIPVIMLTAKSQQEDIVGGLDLGADDYLTKPFIMAELVARVHSKIKRPPMPIEYLAKDKQTGLLAHQQFYEQVERELARTARGGANGCLALLSLIELPEIRANFGTRMEGALAKKIAIFLETETRSLDLIGRDRQGRFEILLPESSAEAVQRRLTELSIRLTTDLFAVGGMKFNVTPIIGYTGFDSATTASQLYKQTSEALERAKSHLDLVPVRFEKNMLPVETSPVVNKRFLPLTNRIDKLRSTLSLPWQITLSYIVGWIIPFFIYAYLDRIGYDVTPIMYMIVVVALAITGILIWVEGFLAMTAMHPSKEPKEPYPPASAIIAAYLPNEAATIIETIEAFLRIEYPASFQVILAYNTPNNMPIEAKLKDIAKQNPRFVPMRIENSTSKAQNVNSALATLNGEFVGIFDADHHPAPDNFTRAWRWLADGYDVVQGHCVVRNGDETWVTRMTAVEFEVIYATSHPGRERLYNFGIFGGSNGYWRTKLLSQTRMRGFMLTEDIDSSIRVTEAGYKIISDPLLISRELAPLTLKALWHQRMRWAQGWYQVSLKHFGQALSSSKLSLRQKIGVVWLLGWREAYPWIAIQMVPLIAYWAIKYGGLDKLDWLVPIFVMTTAFTFSVGPGQTLFAYLLSVPEIHQRKKWFIFYLFITTLFYTEFKNLVGRIAQIKEIMRERQWKITPRVSRPT